MSDLSSLKTNFLNVTTAEEKKIVAFGLSHLVLIVFIVLALVSCVYLWDSKRADLADARAVLSEAKAQVLDQQNKDTQKQNVIFQQQTTVQVQALVEQNKVLQNQVTQLAKAIADRDAAFLQRKQEIVTLAPSTLATQWGQAAAEPAPAIDTIGNFLVPLPLAQKSLEALNEVVALQLDVRDLKTQVAVETQAKGNAEAALAKEQDALTKEKDAHLADVKACGVDKQALGDQITKVKRDATKSKFKWAVGGFVSGAVTVTIALIHFM